MRILSDMFGDIVRDAEGDIPVGLQYLLWLVGGAPRLLAATLEDIATMYPTECILDDCLVLDAMWARVESLDMSDVNEITRKQTPIFSDVASVEVCGNLLALTLSQARVRLSTPLSSKGWVTVNDAAAAQLCYLVACDDSRVDYFISIPPLHLQTMHRMSCPTDFCRIPILDDCTDIYHSRTNEATVLCSLLYRCQAHRVLNIGHGGAANRVLLSELLGLQLPAHLQDTTVKMILHAEHAEEQCV